jgi:hypothetical protein
VILNGCVNLINQALGALKEIERELAILTSVHTIRSFKNEGASMSQIYGYLRVSSIMQVEGDSLDTQARQITAYAASKNWNVPTENIYVEAGVSGSIDFNERPEG